MTNVRNKLRRTSVKVTAWVLLFVSLFAAVGGSVMTAEMQEYGLYSPALQSQGIVQYTETAYWENHFHNMTAQVESMAQAIVHLERQDPENLRVANVTDRMDWTPRDLLAEKNFHSVMQDPRGNTTYYGEYVENYINWGYYDTHSTATNFRYRMMLDLSGDELLVLETPCSRDNAEPFRFAEDAQKITGDGYTITVGVDESFPVRDEFSTYAEFVRNMFAYRWIVVIAAVVGWALSLVLALVLLVLSGKRPDTDEIALTFYDRIPFDLLLCVVVTAVVCGFGFGGSFAFPMYHGAGNTFRLMMLTVGTLLMGSSAWLSMLTLASLITRVRAHTLWSNNLLVRFGSRIWGFCKKHLGWAFGRLRDGTKFTAHYIVAGGAARIGLVILLGALLVSLALSFFIALVYEEMGVFVWSLFLLIFWAGGALVALGQMVTLDKGAQELAAGNLSHKIETEKLWIGFKGHAESLNAIADGMNAAVEHRMKSERLKTELLTNVSHDIKTPLTSIINYVDLLRAAEDDEHAQEYLDVLDRQSKRLGKLLEDLLEASKASTGNIRAELAPTDVSELLRQAAGEYEERLTAAQLTPVITLPAGKTTVLADGRLLWRIFDNMLNNIVKYSLPGTRVYLAVENQGENWRVTFKNISREPLNIAADELMERFVRGDASRTTEGNGLGLSIAQSLADCMNADFALSIDGDLFRASVTLKKHTEA